MAGSRHSLAPLPIRHTAFTVSSELRNRPFTQMDEAGARAATDRGDDAWHARGPGRRTTNGPAALAADGGGCARPARRPRRARRRRGSPRPGRLPTARAFTDGARGRASGWARRAEPTGRHTAGRNTRRDRCGLAHHGRDRFARGRVSSSDRDRGADRRYAAGACDGDCGNGRNPTWYSSRNRHHPGRGHETGRRHAAVDTGAIKRRRTGEFGACPPGAPGSIRHPRARGIPGAYRDCSGHRRLPTNGRGRLCDAGHASCGPDTCGLDWDGCRAERGHGGTHYRRLDASHHDGLPCSQQSGPPGRSLAGRRAHGWCRRERRSGARHGDCPACARGPVRGAARRRTIHPGD